MLNKVNDDYMSTTIAQLISFSQYVESQLPAFDRSTAENRAQWDTFESKSFTLTFDDRSIEIINMSDTYDAITRMLVELYKDLADGYIA